jgi:hypothetical protein
LVAVPAFVAVNPLSLDVFTSKGFKTNASSDVDDVDGVAADVVSIGTFFAGTGVEGSLGCATCALAGKAATDKTATTGKKEGRKRNAFRVIGRSASVAKQQAG